MPPIGAIHVHMRVREGRMTFCQRRGTWPLPGRVGRAEVVPGVASKRTNDENEDSRPTTGADAVKNPAAAIAVEPA